MFHPLELRRAFALSIFLVVAPLGFGGSPQFISSRLLWNAANHSMCTDLVLFRGKMFCTFREGDSHASHHKKKLDNGKLRVLESSDGETWTSAALIEEPGIDLRDPHFSITPDGRLMIVSGGTVWGKEDGSYVSRQTRVHFSTDGKKWTAPQPILGEGDWLWRVTWHKGRAYGVSYHGGGGNRVLPRKAFLYSGPDGIRYDLITELRVPGMNETTVRFLPGDEMILLGRREYENAHGRIGTSKPPYRDWKWEETEFRLGGPNFVDIPGQGWWAGSRLFISSTTPDDKTIYRTALFRMDRKSLQPEVILPSGGDGSYPGLLWHKNILWVSYYSSHEGKTSIYLAKLRF